VCSTLSHEHCSTHCRFLRWKAIQDAAFIDPADGKKKCWSETHVSEDFDQALRLQMRGWSLRWASYSNGGFQEGVSLTADDEVSRAAGYRSQRAFADSLCSSIDGRSTPTGALSCFSTH
jgi:membrane glycosyltransferase